MCVFLCDLVHIPRKEGSVETLIIVNAVRTLFTPKVTHNVVP